MGKWFKDVENDRVKTAKENEKKVGP